MNPEAEGRAAAQRFREDHHLGVQPLGDLAAIIEQATGVDVAFLDAVPDEHGLTMLDPQRKVAFIGVARTPHPMRQRSTLAHELAHVQFEDQVDINTGNWIDSTPEEDRARCFARHLLVPPAGLRQFVGEPRTVSESTLSKVVQRFLVSPAIAAIALEQAGYIDAATRQRWTRLATPQLAVRFGWSDQYHALQAESNQRRAPQRLLARAIVGYEDGLLSAQTIATLRGVDLKTTEAELRDAGIAPVEQPVPWAHSADMPEVHVDLAALDQALNEPDGDDQDAGAEDRTT